MVFSYTKSESSGTSMPAEPAESVVREKPCPIVAVDRVSSGRIHRCWEEGWRFRMVQDAMKLWDRL